MISRYGVRYIYVGPVERHTSSRSERPSHASREGVAKFEAMVGETLDVAYRNAGVTIYKVRPSTQWPPRRSPPTPMGDAVRWLLTLQVSAMAALPLTGLALRALPDRGYALSKVAGWALASWIAWVVAATGLVGRSSTLDSYAVLAVAGRLVSHAALAQGGYMRAWVLYFRERWAYVLCSSRRRSLGRSSASYCCARTCEVSGTEKPMELMYLQSLYSSSSLPPDDLWLSGRPANYYYYGYYMNAFVGRMSRAPAVAFNLSLAGVWASTLVALGGVAYNGVIAGNGRRLRAVAAAAGPRTRADREQPGGCTGSVERD
ncbi:MAG: DUF2298 domain-containing protein [Chloroflexia bacterium]